MNYEKLGIVFGTAGIMLSACLYLRLKKINRNVDMTLEELSTKAKIDVEKSMVNKAVQRAVDREVGYQISYVS